MRSKPFEHQIVAFVGLLIVTSTCSGAANLLVNGSFEDPVVSSNLNFTGLFTFPGWTAFSTGTGNGGGNAGIVPGVDFGLAPSDGNQAFSFNGDNPPTGTYLEQTLATLPGHLYFLSFGIGRNNGFSSQTLRLQVQIFDSSSAQISFGQFSPPSTVGYASEQIGFIGNSTTSRLRFTDVSGSNPNTDVFMDNVVIAEVPEPATLALVIVIMGALLSLRFRLPVGVRNATSSFVGNSRVHA